jgi:hypothetical protein
VESREKFRLLSSGKFREGLVRAGVMALALGWLFFALFPLLAGGWIMSQWGAVSIVLFGFGVVMFLGAAAAVAATGWLLVRLGLPERPLWMGSIGSLLSGVALSTAAFTHIYPCSGPD